jgi:hypothetical protein
MSGEERGLCDGLSWMDRRPASVAYHGVMAMQRRFLPLMIVAAGTLAVYVHRKSRQKALAQQTWEDDDHLAEIIRHALPAMQRAGGL